MKNYSYILLYIFILLNCNRSKYSLRDSLILETPKGSAYIFYATSSFPVVDTVAGPDMAYILLMGWYYSVIDSLCSLRSGKRIKYKFIENCVSDYHKNHKSFPTIKITDTIVTIRDTLTNFALEDISNCAIVN